ncbi:MAG: hypothetical protein JWM26_3886, partial [Betaproteobacteria bacterium]|nr:hypothetical protein [Betaproteobacteria bacterium]
LSEAGVPHKKGGAAAAMDYLSGAENTQQDRAAA